MTEPLKTPKMGESVHAERNGLKIELKRIEPRKYDWDHRGRSAHPN